MYKLSINTAGNVWALLFKDKDGADKAEESVLGFLRTQAFSQTVAGERVVTLEDDYGQRAHIVAGSLQSMLIEDLDLTQEAVVQMSLHQARTNVKVQSRAQGDATLKAAQLGNGGGVMFDPMAGRRFS